VVGVISGTISDKTGGKFTAVVPANLVVEMLTDLDHLTSACN
jgi:hypothetical protein